MLKQPIGVVKHTNVAVVRLKIAKKKFELAIYKNKIQSYRSKVETDLNEVLQIDKIYTNVGKGELAQKTELEEHFKGMTYEEIIKLILDKGEIQVSDKERDLNFSNTKNEIANIILEKTFDLDTGLKFSHQMILQALNDVNFVVKNDKPAKPQALQAIKLIQERKVLNMERKLLETQITLKKQFKEENISEYKSFVEKFLSYLKGIESKITLQEVDNQEKFKILCDILPNYYREILTKFEEFVSVEILSNAKVVQKDQTEEMIESFKNLEKKKNEKKNEMKISNTYIDKFLEEDNTNDKKKVKTIKCTKCKDSEFFEQDELRKHYKSDFHNFNVKRLAQGLSAVNAEEYIDEIHLNK